MKTFTSLLLACLFPTLALSAEEPVRNETRTRVIGENVLTVSACSQPEVSTQEFQEVARKADGTIITDRDGNYKYVKMTRITAKSSFTMRKCQVKETYTVEIKGKGWNADVTEVPGSARQEGIVTTDSSTVTKYQDINLKKLLESTNGGSGWDPNDSGAQLILNLAEGLKRQAKDECEGKAANLSRNAVDISQTQCR